MIEFDDVSFTYPGGKEPVFERLSLALPEGVISCLGQNAAGKSTFLLLAGGRLKPDRGAVRIDGRDTKSFTTEEARAEYAAFVYQNMEFETGEPVAGLLRYVYENGFHTEKDPSFVDELVGVFELESCLERKISRLSKGELQRAVIAFSLLYGSRHLMMDEPVFALEDAQKRAALGFISAYVRKKGIGLSYSLHELDLSREFSDHLLIFYKRRPPRLGTTAELFTREILEEAYEAPLDTLKHRESLFRDVLLRLDEIHRHPPEKRNN
ncbi:MAG: ABC transporter ATP-binding protein [Spirochaetales bacterium]|nr:ABC transporter ATP-binding protein [Spirochaetales bacterium]